MGQWGGGGVRVGALQNLNHEVVVCKWGQTEGHILTAM